MTSPQQPSSSPRPFAAVPDPNRYFPAHAIEEARQRVARSIQRGEGPVLVIGGAGLGKTMLLEVVAQQFREQLRSVRLIGGQLCTRRALLQSILFQLDLPYRDMDECELRLALLGYLQPPGAEMRRILLLVDEAEALPVRLLEELRALVNLSGSGQLLVSLVLAGNATLEEQFADPKLDLFSQRIAGRGYLATFGREETFQYIRAQVAATDTDPTTLFTDDGLEAIFAVTDGVPRLINQLCDQLLWMVAETGYAPLDGDVVQQAWSELQQLPAPWNIQSSEALGSPVEYGELDADAFDTIEESAEYQSDDSHTFEHNAIDVSAENLAEDFDDMPASIPLHAPLVSDSEIVVDLTEEDTYDVAEHILEQLSVLDSATATPSAQLQHVPPANNPFAEVFDSEEIVLDHHSAFERLVLAEAPRVVNSVDTAFAQQLQELEAPEATSQVPEPVAATCDVSCSVGCHAEKNEEATVLDEPSELLVIEDGEPSETTIVEGPKFRQLFSSLEQVENTPRFG